jgi:hypothetical protein
MDNIINRISVSEVDHWGGIWRWSCSVSEGPKYEPSEVNEGLIVIICSGIVKSVIISCILLMDAIWQSFLCYEVVTDIDEVGARLVVVYDRWVILLWWLVIVVDWLARWFTDFSRVEFRLAEEGVRNSRIVIAAWMHIYFMAWLLVCALALYLYSEYFALVLLLLRVRL